MAYIEQKELTSVAVKYEEDIESVTIFPQSGEIEVKTYKRFYDAQGKLSRTESATTEKFKQDVPSITEQLRNLIKTRRGK